MPIYRFLLTFISIILAIAIASLCSLVPVTRCLSVRALSGDQTSILAVPCRSVFSRVYRKEIFPCFADIAIQSAILAYATTSMPQILGIDVGKILICVFVNTLISLLLKNNITAPRPSACSLLAKHGLSPNTDNHYVVDTSVANFDIIDALQSFPSGHTATASMLMLLTLSITESWLVAAMSVITAFIIAMSRIVGNRHHPIDVFAGFSLAFGVFKLFTIWL